MAADRIVAEIQPGRCRLDKRQEHKGHGSIGVMQDDRPDQLVEFPGNIKPLFFQHPAAEGQAGRAVMIAADDEKGNPRFRRNLRRDFIKQGHGVCRRQAAVVYVAGQHDGVDALVPDHRQKLFRQHIGLVVRQVIAVK